MNCPCLGEDSTSLPEAVLAVWRAEELARLESISSTLHYENISKNVFISARKAEHGLLGHSRLALGVISTVLSGRWQFQGVSMVFFKVLFLNILHMVKNAFREDLWAFKRQRGVQGVTHWERGHRTAAEAFPVTHLESLKKYDITYGYLPSQLVQTAVSVGFSSSWSNFKLQSSSC